MNWRRTQALRGTLDVCGMMGLGFSGPAFTSQIAELEVLKLKNVLIEPGATIGGN